MALLSFADNFWQIYVDYRSGAVNVSKSGGIEERVTGFVASAVAT